MCENDTVIRIAMIPGSFSIIDIHRKNIIGGGERLLYEFAEVELTFYSTKFTIFVLYRTPYSEKHPVTKKNFFHGNRELFKYINL